MLPQSLIIQTARLSEAAKPLAGELSSQIAELEEDRQTSFRDPVEYSFQVQRLGNELLVMGQMGVAVELMCSKCAEKFSTNLIDSSFVRTFPLAAEGIEVDITQDLREAILLMLPHHPLCSEDCKGLCPFCGVNQNRETCTCEAPAADDRWGDLDNLKM